MPRSVANALLNQQFRQALTPGAGHLMPGAANALAARVIEATGHKMLMVSGAAVANTYLGAPDIGLVSLAELAAHVGAIRDAVNIPLLVDGDTGFGNAINVVHTVGCSSVPVPTASCWRTKPFPSVAATLKTKPSSPSRRWCKKSRPRWTPAKTIS